MSTNNTCFNKERSKKEHRCNLKTEKLLDYALIGVHAVIRSVTS